MYPSSTSLCIFPIKWGPHGCRVPRRREPVFTRTARLTGWRLAGVVAAVGALVVVTAGTGSAASSANTYQIQLDPKISTPITAANFSPTGSCAGFVPPGQDGWHFAVPGDASFIVSLDLSFNSPVSIAYTADRQQAYVATQPGAQLTQASANVITLPGQPQVQALELANTCPAQAGSPTASPSATGTSSPFPFSFLPTGTP